MGEKTKVDIFKHVKGKLVRLVDSTAPRASLTRGKHSPTELLPQPSAHTGPHKAASVGLKLTSIVEGLELLVLLESQK